MTRNARRLSLRSHHRSGRHAGRLRRRRRRLRGGASGDLAGARFGERFERRLHRLPEAARRFVGRSSRSGGYQHGDGAARRRHQLARSFDLIGKGSRPRPRSPSGGEAEGAALCAAGIALARHPHPSNEDRRDFNSRAPPAHHRRRDEEGREDARASEGQRDQGAEAAVSGEAVGNAAPAADEPGRVSTGRQARRPTRSRHRGRFGHRTCGRHRVRQGRRRRRRLLQRERRRRRGDPTTRRDRAPAPAAC